MLNVSMATKKAYTRNNVPKNLTISFPGSNIPDITNSHIVEESMKLNQSICEDSTLRLGGCNASQFEIMVFDIQEELKDKNIVVTMDIKDRNYKGAHQIETDYVADNVVKYNGEYYKYFRDTVGEYTEKTIRRSYDTATNRYGSNDNIYNIGFNWVINTDIDQSICVNYPESEMPANTIIKFTIWWDGNGGEYETGYTLRNGSVLTIPKSNTIGGITSKPKGYWLRAENSSGTDMAEFSRKVEVITYQKELISKCTPDEIVDYCEKEYGYIDTSNTNDIVIFRGKIDSAEKQQDKRYKQIIAYDKMKELSETSVKEWFNTSRFAKSYDEDNVELWGMYITYTRGELVKNFEPVESTGWLQERQFRCKNTLDKERLTTLSPIDAIDMTVITGCHFPGSYYWEEIPSSEWIHPTIGELRNELCEHLGIEQEEVTLPMDGALLWCKAFEDEIDARKLLQFICDINGCFGIIDAATGKMKYIVLKTAVPNLNYKGNYSYDVEYEGTYSGLDIVKVNDELTEYNTVYYQCLITNTGIHPALEKVGAGGVPYWKILDDAGLYHPSGNVNLTELYENGSLDYKDNIFMGTGVKIVDESGAIISGTDKDDYIPITYNFLWSGWNKLDLLNENLENAQYNEIEYQPTKIKTLGLPFLECGDNVCVDVTDEYEDADGNIVEENKTIQTIVFNRTLSGIHALADEIEAKRE